MVTRGWLIRRGSLVDSLRRPQCYICLADLDLYVRLMLTSVSGLMLENED